MNTTICLSMEQEEKNQIALNAQDVEDLVSLIQREIRATAIICRQNELIMNNEPLRCQYTQFELEKMAKQTKAKYHSIIVYKRIANKLKEGMYHPEELNE